MSFPGLAPVKRHCKPARSGRIPCRWLGVITSCVVLAVLAGTAALVGRIGNSLAARTAERFVLRLRAAVFRDVQDLPPHFFHPVVFSATAAFWPRRDLAPAAFVLAPLFLLAARRFSRAVRRGPSRRCACSR